MQIIRTSVYESSLSSTLEFICICSKLPMEQKFSKKCFNCESNTGPSDLQSDALPTELLKQLGFLGKQVFIQSFIMVYIDKLWGSLLHDDFNR